MSGIKPIAVVDGSQGAIPSLREFLIEWGLYRQTPVSAEFNSIVRYGEIVFDAYCTGCGEHATFRRKQLTNEKPTALMVMSPTKIILPEIQVTAICTRSGHLYRFYVIAHEHRLTKVGQYPSYGDIAVGEVGIDIKVLEADDRREFVKALRLFSSDVSIGAFVYLRRIFERLIARIHTQYTTDHGAIDQYDKMNMGEKIEALRTALPRAVTANAGIWSILSSGIHQLSESDCKIYFPVMKAAIEQILEQEAHQQRARISAAETERAVGAILSSMKGSPKPSAE